MLGRLDLVCWMGSNPSKTRERLASRMNWLLPPGAGHWPSWTFSNAHKCQSLGACTTPVLALRGACRTSSRASHAFQSPHSALWRRSGPLLWLTQMAKTAVCYFNCWLEQLMLPFGDCFYSVLWLSEGLALLNALWGCSLPACLSSSRNVRDSVLSSGKWRIVGPYFEPWKWDKEWTRKYRWTWVLYDVLKRAVVVLSPRYFCSHPVGMKNRKEHRLRSSSDVGLRSSSTCRVSQFHWALAYT